MKLQQAIDIFDQMKGWHWVGKYRHFNLDTNRTETAHVFWDHKTQTKVTFDCLGQLRFYAKQVAYTHGVAA